MIQKTTKNNMKNKVFDETGKVEKGLLIIQSLIEKLEFY